MTPKTHYVNRRYLRELSETANIYLRCVSCTFVAGVALARPPARPLVADWMEYAVCIHYSVFLYYSLSLLHTPGTDQDVGWRPAAASVVVNADQLCTVKLHPFKISLSLSCCQFLQFSFFVPAFGTRWRLSIHAD